MAQDILITPGSGIPQIDFTASGVSDSIELNVIWSGTVGQHATGTALSFDGSQGTVFLMESGSVTAPTGMTVNRNTPAVTTDKLYNVGGSLYFNGSEVGGDGVPSATGALIGQNTTDITAVSGNVTAVSGDLRTGGSGLMLDGTSLNVSGIDTALINDNAVTLAKMAGIARGKIIYGDSNGDPAVLAPGSADQVLTSDGTDISWEDAGGGAGDITAVVAGNGLSGGATSGSATLNVSGVYPDLISETVTVAKGGTNATSFADKAVIITQDSGDDTLAAAAMDANGELLIGGTSGPAVATLTQGSNMTITNGNGTITLAAAGAGGGPSDERLKNNISKFEITDAMEKLEKLDIVEFDWAEKAKELFDKEGHDFGLIAQDVEKILPELVGEFNNYKIIEYYKICLFLIDAVKELKSEIGNLKEEINKLKDEE